MLNRIWTAFFLTAFAAALWQWLVLDDVEVFARLVKSTFDMARLSVDIAIGLAGVLTLWMGLMKIVERGGLADGMARLLAPLFSRLMPEVPKGHPALGSISMNLAANMMGLDNAATPMGLKAMEQLQTLNPEPEKASNAQILFLVLNTSSVTLFPVTILMYRAQMGAFDPGDVFIPIILATSFSTLAGLLAVAYVQRIRLWDSVILAWLGGLGLLIGLLVGYLMLSPVEELALRSSALGNGFLIAAIGFFLLNGIRKKLNLYEVFIEGAKDGFHLAVKLIPYLVAMLVAIGLLRSSGLLELLIEMIRWLVTALGFNTAFVDALPTAIMKPLSGSGARAMMLETFNTHGVDSFAGHLSAIIQGSTETTFYVLTVYFGSVGIKKIRHALGCGLFADFAGIVAAIFIAYWFFYP